MRPTPPDGLNIAGVAAQVARHKAQPCNRPTRAAGGRLSCSCMLAQPHLSEAPPASHTPSSPLSHSPSLPPSPSPALWSPGVIHLVTCRQRIFLSMACRNPRRQLMCEPPAIKRIDYYCHSDLSLAGFIGAAAPHPAKKCQVGVHVRACPGGPECTRMHREVHWKPRHVHDDDMLLVCEGCSLCSHECRF